jgi:hypothetical protein
MPFQPGQSGNPAGRPRGARNNTTVLIEQLIEGDAEFIMRQAHRAGESGQSQGPGPADAGTPAQAQGQPD